MGEAADVLAWRHGGVLHLSGGWLGRKGDHGRVPPRDLARLVRETDGGRLTILTRGAFRARDRHMSSDRPARSSRHITEHLAAGEIDRQQLWGCHIRTDRVPPIRRIAWLAPTVWVMLGGPTHPFHLHGIKRPPHTLRDCPVMYPASSDARNATTLATSLGVPERPRGTWRIRSSIISPGA